MSKIQGKKPGYELVFITRVDLTDDGLKTLKEKINAIIATFRGEVVYQEDWGKRKLAYPINKETRGHYTYLVFTADAEVVAEIERNLRLSEFVVRFLTVNLSKEFDRDAYNKEYANGTPLKREERAPGSEGSEIKPAAAFAG